MRFQVIGRTIQQHGTSLGLQGDNKVERIEFAMPKLYDGIDLSEGMAFVLFSTVSNQEGYIPDITKTIEGDEIVLTWLVGSQVTVETGVLYIALKISGLDGVLWHSDMSMFSVGRSIQVESPQPVAFRSAKARIASPDAEPPITVVERKIMVPGVLQNIAVQNDKNSEIVLIKMPRYFDGNDLSKYSVILKTIMPEDGGRDDIPFLNPTLTADEISFHWTLNPPQTSFIGRVQLQIVVSGTKPDGEPFKWETDDTASVNILRSLDAEPVIPTTPSIMEEFLRQLTALAAAAAASETAARGSEINAAESAESAKSEADRASSVAVKTPYIGEDGHWYVWDLALSEYVKTDSMANGNVMYATFEIDPATGVITQTTPDGYHGATFEIVNDHLEVSV